LLISWHDDLSRCSRIFLRSPRHNRAVFFGGKKPLFSRSDPRLAVISTETRRPTFHEVQRVHGVLAAVQVFCGVLRLLKVITIIRKCLITYQFKTQCEVDVFIWDN